MGPSILYISWIDMNRGLWLWSRVWRLCPQWTAVVPDEPDKGTGHKRPREVKRRMKRDGTVEMRSFGRSEDGETEVLARRSRCAFPAAITDGGSPAPRFNVLLSTSSFTHSLLLLYVAIFSHCIIPDTIPAFSILDGHIYVILISMFLLFECR